MAATIPDSHKDLLTGPVYSVLTTVMPDGQPQSTVVWCDYDGQRIRVNTAQGRQKEKNMRANPKVTLIAIDPNNPYRWIEVRGVVDEITEAGGVEGINALAKLYVGVDEYYGGWAPADLRGKETRLNVYIKPTRVTVVGN